MRIRNFIRIAPFTIISVAVVFTGCSSSPMKSRLDKNFVYNCSLELIKKDVAAADAERICTSSHREEMMEDQAARQQEAPPVQAPAVAPPAKPQGPQRAPVSETAPLATPVLTAPAK